MAHVYTGAGFCGACRDHSSGHQNPQGALPGRAVVWRGTFPIARAVSRLTVYYQHQGLSTWPNMFYDNYHLVSAAVFWLWCKPRCKFMVPISMEIQHCARAENISKLSFLKALCSQENFPYTFRPVFSLCCLREELYRPIMQCTPV